MPKPKRGSALTQQARINRALASTMLKRGATYAAVQRATGLTPKVISALKKGDAEPDWSIVADLEGLERNKLTLLVDQLVTAAMDPSRIEAARLSEVSTALNVAIHSRQLLSGKPTEIREYRTMSVRDLLELRAQMLEQAGLKGLGGGSIDVTEEGVP